MNLTIIEGSFYILIFDLLALTITSLILNNKKDKKKEVNYNARWFFIHILVNLNVVVYTYKDLIYCIKNFEKCTLEHTDTDAYYAINLVIISHIYHLIVFYKHLKPDDIIHHITMCVFNGYVFYMQNLKIQSVTAFFCSGLPGLIDYFLLYLVKIKKLDIKIEKRVYLFLSTYIRSPGCVLALVISFPYFLREQSNFDFYLSLLSILTVFINGQYYMSKTCIDYGKKINR